MSNATKTTVSRDAILEAVRDRYLRALSLGGGRWYYVRVWPTGEICDGMEASELIPESEYFHRRPHPVTIWSEIVNSDLSDEEVEECRDEINVDPWTWLDQMCPDLDAAIEPTGCELVD